MSVLDDPKSRTSFEKSYVIVRPDVLENAAKKDQENPDGEETMVALGRKDAGLPYFAIVSPDGTKIGNSLITPGNPKTNTGHPSTPEEIAHFSRLLQTTANAMDAASKAQIEAYLRADAAKR